MTPELINNIYINGGVIACIVVSFFTLVIYVVKAGEKRENRLYGIIDILSKELPAIKSELQEIKNKIH